MQQEQKNKRRNKIIENHFVTRIIHRTFRSVHTRCRVQIQLTVLNREQSKGHSLKKQLSLLKMIALKNTQVPENIICEKTLVTTGRVFLSLNKYQKL